MRLEQRATPIIEEIADIERRKFPGNFSSIVVVVLFVILHLAGGDLRFH